MPNFVVRVVALFDKTVRMPATFLGRNTACSNAKARDRLGWRPRSAEEAIVATAESMIRLGLVN